ncbi:chromosome partitioning protein ParA [Vibrio maritimus]
MRRMTLIMVSVILAGTTLLYFSGTKLPHLHEVSRKEQTSRDTQNTALSDASTSPLSTRAANVREARKEDGQSTRLEHYAYQLQSTKGKKRIEMLESFWRSCLSLHSCDDSLAALKQIMPQNYFELIKHYPELRHLWQQKLGTLHFESDQSLKSRIAQFKHQARLVWGEWADILLSDEFAAYDFNLEHQNLSQESPEQYREAFEALLESSQEQDLGLDTNVAKFEKAVSALPGTMSEQEKSTFVAELERTYLSQTQKQNIQAREQQVTTQQHVIRNYHVELSQLESRLSQQRNTQYAELTDIQWQTLYQQKVSEFRREFFDNFSE